MNKGLIRRSLSALKRLSNGPLYVIKKRVGQQEIDYDTGEIPDNIDTYLVSRPIIVPENNSATHIFSQAYTQANRQFTYGADFTRTRVEVIIDLRDLPRGIKITTNDRVKMNDDEYMILHPDTDITGSYYQMTLERVRL